MVGAWGVHGRLHGRCTRAAWAHIVPCRCDTFYAYTCAAQPNYRAAQPIIRCAHGGCMAGAWWVHEGGCMGGCTGGCMKTARWMHETAWEVHEGCMVGACGLHGGCMTAAWEVHEGCMVGA